LLEFCDGLAKLRYRGLAVRSVEYLRRDQTVEIVSTSSQILHAAWQLFKSRSDKEWGLTDCTSFVIMRQLGLHVALTADRHFQQAGFQALLLQGNGPID
jgi:predicted nucleic acid-binding protein